jgi:hypothetical protein
MHLTLNSEQRKCCSKNTSKHSDGGCCRRADTRTIYVDHVDRVRHLKSFVSKDRFAVLEQERREGLENSQRSENSQMQRNQTR